MQKEINLKVLFDVITRRLWLILITAGIAAFAGGLISYLSEEPPPVYQTSTSILLNSDNSSTSTLEAILRDPTVMSTVIEELELEKTTNKLSEQITFIDEGGKIVKITVLDNNPELAAEIANLTASVFMKQVGSILGIYDTRIVSEALVNTVPITTSAGSSLVKNIILGLAAGLVVGIGLVLFLDSLDDSIRSENEIEQLLDVSVLGSVAKMTKINVENNPGERRKKKR